LTGWLKGSLGGLLGGTLAGLALYMRSVACYSIKKSNVMMGTVGCLNLREQRVNSDGCENLPRCAPNPPRNGQRRVEQVSLLLSRERKAGWRMYGSPRFRPWTEHRRQLRWYRGRSDFRPYSDGSLFGFRVSGFRVSPGVWVYGFHASPGVRASSLLASPSVRVSDETCGIAAPFWRR
jgi:hypothetical protein